MITVEYGVHNILHSFTGTLKGNPLHDALCRNRLRYILLNYFKLFQYYKLLQTY